MPLDESIKTTLLEQLGDSDRIVRNEAAETLSSFDPQDALPLALNALYDQTNAGKRNAALEVLKRFGPRIVPFLADHLQSQDPDVRMFLLTLIGDLRDQTYLHFVLSSLQDPEENVAAAAISAIGRIGDPSLAPYLIDMLRSPSVWLRYQAIEAAGEMQDASLLPHLVRMLESSFCRKAVIKALGRFQHPDAYRSLSSLMIPGEQCDFDAIDSLIRLYHSAIPAEKAAIRKTCRATVDQSRTQTFLRKMKNGIRPEQFSIAQVLAWCGNIEGLQQLRNFETDSQFGDQALRTLLSLQELGSSAIPFPMSDSVYKRMTDLLHEFSGLRFDDSSKYMISRRLNPRLEELHLRSFEDYISHLMEAPDHDAEIDRIFDIITTHETYFFREEKQLLAFSDEILPEIVANRKQFRSLRIWSGGCSSGEEPYTIAILCLENQQLRDWNVQIIATDISQHMVNKARCGMYGESSFRSTSEIVRDKYFQFQEKGLYRVNDEVQQLVRFMKLNLIDENSVGMLGEVDVIFCRNVLIYFDLDAKKKVFETFFQKLRKGGFLLLGHSESLINLSTGFKLRHLKNDLVYQK